MILGLGNDPLSRRFAINLFVAFLPAALMGLAFNHAIKTVLFKPVPVAIAFIVGGIIIIFVERRRRPARIKSVDDMTWRDALKVGIAQTAALIPGTSRSGATIIGGSGRLRVIADVTRPDVINKILEHVARQRAPPELSAISRMTTVH